MFDTFSARKYIEDARRLINHVRTASGVGQNPPLTPAQHERLDDAYKELGKALQTMRK
jgi:hypothetical protein